MTVAEPHLRPPPGSEPVRRRFAPSPAAPEPQELLAAHALSDKAHLSFEHCFRENYAALVAALTTACGSRESAEDAVQEAFARAHLRWSRVSRYDNPAAWVRRVATNLTIDQARRRERKRRLLPRIIARDHVEEPRSDGIEALLDALTPQQRLVAALVYVADRPLAEVAEILGLSEGTVKFHLHGARARLRAALDPGAKQ